MAMRLRVSTVRGRFSKVYPSIPHPPHLEGGKMKKETLDFLWGNKNAVIDEFVLGREQQGKSELIYVSLPDSESPLYTFWNNKRVKRKYILKKTEEKLLEVKPVIPNGTGGKEAYVMLMIKEVSAIDVSIEAKGAILGFISCLEWNTGRICRQRDMKSMTLPMIAEHLGTGRVKAKGIMKELVAVKVAWYDRKKKAYFMSRKFVKKGMAANED